MANTTNLRRPWTDRLKDGWPIALAVGMAALSFGGSGSAEGVASLSQVLLLLPLLYLVVAKLRRPQASWLVLVVLITPFLVLRALDVVAPTAVFSAVALLVLVWGALDGQLRPPDPFRVQALGMLGFGALALAGWSWIRTWAATWSRPAGSATASGTSSTGGPTGLWPAPTPCGAASSTSGSPPS